MPRMAQTVDTRKYVWRKLAWFKAQPRCMFLFDDFDNGKPMAHLLGQSLLDWRS